MSTFSTTVTKAQRNASGIDAHGFAVSPDSRHNINSPGYNRSPYEPVTKKKANTLGDILRRAVAKQDANTTTVATKRLVRSAQVRPTTKRGQRQEKP